MKHPPRRTWRSTFVSIFWVFVIALAFRTFLYQPNSIPSASMLPALLVGDYLFVSKYAYGYSRYSLPVPLPLPEGRLWSALPERGDIVVFKLPSDPAQDYIKRVIGLPRDEIQMIDGRIFLNGQIIDQQQTGTMLTRSPYGNSRLAVQKKETLPNGVSYTTLDTITGSAGDNTSAFLVPDNHIFVMGDNRDNSNDSRMPDGVGFVPFDNVAGRASIVYFSVREGESPWRIWEWPFSVRWGRVGDSVR